MNWLGIPIDNRWTNLLDLTRNNFQEHLNTRIKVKSMKDIIFEIIQNRIKNHKFETIKLSRNIKVLTKKKWSSSRTHTQWTKHLKAKDFILKLKSQELKFLRKWLNLKTMLMIEDNKRSLQVTPSSKTGDILAPGNQLSHQCKKLKDKCRNNTITICKKFSKK
jgi:hypothetical protein